MQFQSDILEAAVLIPEAEELSGIGAAYMAGLTMKVWDETVFRRMKRSQYQPKMEEDIRQRKLTGWKKAVQSVLKG